MLFRSRDNLLHELEQGNAGVCGPAAADVLASALAMLDDADVAENPPRAPRWEPAFAAALKRMGLETELRTEAACVPSS